MLSIPHLVLFLLIAVLLFGGGGKLSKIMGDIGKGIKNMRDELGHDEKDTKVDTARQQVLPPEDKTPHN